MEVFFDKNFSLKFSLFFFSALTLGIPPAFASIPPVGGAQIQTSPETKKPVPSLKDVIQSRIKKNTAVNSSSLVFDLPVTYNKKVSYWITYFQENGKFWFREWLERSTKYMPFIQRELKNAGLPQDLAFMVMIESGFLANAVSHASAVGPWQFISATGKRYGLQQSWWLDERRDLEKSTKAAIKYLRDLYSEFGSWYLVAASYNMGEGGLRRQINKHQTKDYWELVRKGALPKETTDYVPKILAAMMISKSPSLYGFFDISQFEVMSYDLVAVPGGTDLKDVSQIIGVTQKSLKDLNSELLLGYVPGQVPRHIIRVPRGAGKLVALKTQEK